jgi:ATP-dependent exoDNAse (exonuclease V) beta subunit
LEGGEDRKVSQFLFVPSAGREEGSIFHAMFEELDWLPLQEGTFERLSTTLASRGLTPEMVANYLKEFSRMLDYPAIRDTLSQQSASRHIQLYRELPFSLREGQQLLRGAIDRVVVHGNGERIEAAEVIDYKTDSIHADQLDSRVDVYRPQVEVYRRAVSKLFRLRNNQVSVRLLFTRIGAVVEC